MLLFKSRLLVIALLSASVAGCSTFGVKGPIVTSSSTRPAMAAAVQSKPVASAPVIPEGADFSTAVAMIAQTPGSGVKSVGKATVGTPDADNSMALALAAIKTDSAPVVAMPSKPKAKPSKPKAAATPKKETAEPAVAATAEIAAASVADPVAPVTCPLDGTRIPGCVPATTVFGQEVAPVKRF